MKKDLHVKTHPLEEAIDIGLQHRNVFDWKDAQGAFTKLKEEISELDEVLMSQNKSEKTFEELSDVFFTLLQVCRHLNFNPEKVIDFANQKYKLRSTAMFQKIENDLKDPKNLALKELESYWQKAKDSTQEDLKGLLKLYLS